MDDILNEDATLGSGPGPLSDARSAVSRVYEDLRKRILELDLPPGTTLSRGALAERYRVSQTPIREALQRLEEDGLVLIKPQSRTVVTRIDPAQLAETQFLRIALETEVVRRLAENPDPAMVARARGILRMQEALSGDLDQAELFNELDRAFHRTFFSALGMQSLHGFVSRKLGHLSRCQRLELPKAGRMDDILSRHKAILDGIANGDPEEAMAQMRTHLTGTISRVSTLRQEFPAYFTA